MFVHLVTCQPQGCGRVFRAVRSDARYCSRSCRRRRVVPTSIESRKSLPTNEIEPTAALADELPDGWRRQGPFLVPPPDPRYIIRVG